MLLMTDEGLINEPNEAFILDDDLNEVHTHAKETGSSDLFEVEATTGNIYSLQYLQLVPGRQYKDYTVRMRATDKDGLTTSRYEVQVRVFDINDRRPYFTNYHQPFRVSAHECLDPGSILGRVKGEDDDSDYNQNNWVYFGGGGGNFDIAANGWVVLNQRCKDGESYTGTATIADQGIKSGPLTGDPMDVIVNCGTPHSHPDIAGTSIRGIAEYSTETPTTASTKTQNSTASTGTSACPGAATGTFYAGLLEGNLHRPRSNSASPWIQTQGRREHAGGRGQRVTA
ncbi:hypothetical protein EGW08_019186 [Elysia chlorotica]|uniref:Cadherin domain-containing protein n=1 Tax=Elysia chlorotica TaxID=188477 RepID=A0A3S1H671_ELYCH|nr:hypothetical protein EGW08_019186 [Elysia chlorotica]